MGLGRDKTVLSFTSSSQDPPYFHSLGPDEDGDDLIFFYYGDWTEFPRRQSVPFAKGREAMRHFFQEGSLLDSIQWEES